MASWGGRATVTSELGGTHRGAASLSRGAHHDLLHCRLAEHDEVVDGVVVDVTVVQQVAKAVGHIDNEGPLRAAERVSNHLCEAPLLRTNRVQGSHEEAPSGGGGRGEDAREGVKAVAKNARRGLLSGVPTLTANSTETKIETLELLAVPFSIHHIKQ